MWVKSKFVQITYFSANEQKMFNQTKITNFTHYYITSTNNRIMNKKCSIELKLPISPCKMHFGHKISTNKRILVQMKKKMFSCTNIHR